MCPVFKGIQWRITQNVPRSWTLNWYVVTWHANADIPFCPVFLDNNLCFLLSPLSPIHSVFSKHIVSPFFVIYNWLIIIIIHWHSASKRSRRLNYKECQMWTVQHAFNGCVCLKMCICGSWIIRVGVVLNVFVDCGTCNVNWLLWVPNDFLRYAYHHVQV
jgi:hypothetical protein